MAHNIYFKFNKKRIFYAKKKHKEQKNKSTRKRFSKFIDQYIAVSHHFQNENNMNEGDINDRLPNYISASLTLPELPQMPTEGLINLSPQAPPKDFIIFIVDLIIGEEDPLSDNNIVYFRLALINNENNYHWRFCILAKGDEFYPQKMITLDPSETLKIVFQADETSSTSKKADNCMNWNARIEAKNKPLFEKKLKLTDPPPHSLQGLNIIAFIFNIEDINILLEKQIDFHKISFKSFSGKALTKNWILSGSQNGKPDHLNILTKKHSSIVPIKVKANIDAAEAGNVISSDKPRHVTR